MRQWGLKGAVQGKVALLLVVIGLLLACNDSTPTPEPTPTPTHQATSDPAVSNAAAVATAAPTPMATIAMTGNLVLWHSWAEADGDALAQILTAFQQTYPDLTVDTLFVAYNDLPQSYADAVLAGSGPDLILAPGWWLGEMVTAQVVQPLDALVQPEVLQAYWPATLENLRWQGRLYALPTHFELVSLFYNRALVPPEKVPTTTGQLLALAKAKRQQGIGLYASLYHLYWGLPAYGAQLLNAEGKVVLDQNQGAAEYLSWLVQLNQLEGAYVDADYGMLLDRFKKGEYAFLVDGPWSIGELRAALGDKLAVTPLPAGPAGPAAPWLSTDGVFLNPNRTPDQQQRALILAQHLTSLESGQILAQTAQRLSAHRQVTTPADPLLQGFMQQAATAQPLPTRPEMTEIWGYGGDLLLKVLTGNSDPVKTVAETTALINDANKK